MDESQVPGGQDHVTERLPSGVPHRPVRAIGIFTGSPADDVIEEFHTRRRTRLALTLSTAAAVILGSFLLAHDAGPIELPSSAGREPGAAGTAQPDGTEPAVESGTSPSPGTGSDPSAGNGRTESGGAAGRPGNATDGDGHTDPGPAVTTAPPTAAAPATTAPVTSANPEATPALVAVSLSTLGGVVVAGCADGKVRVLDVRPAPGAKVVSMDGGARDTARVEIDLLAAKLRLNVRCVAGLPVATPV
ncbi:hypothetical protein [Dactylosporangium sp. NPDC006015]|uniref:hypothetical protein n=1 Tax=Dactylosporangium sp. NPDC006015 TaxID=3154576 RepID=UPI0033B3C07D